MDKPTSILLRKITEKLPCTIEDTVFIYTHLSDEFKNEEDIISCYNYIYRRAFGIEYFRQIVNSGSNLDFIALEARKELNL